MKLSNSGKRADGPMMRTRRRIPRGMAGNYLTNLAVVVSGGLSGLLVARSLGPSGKGVVTSVQAVGFGLGAFLDLSIDQAVVFFSARFGWRIRPTVEQLGRVVAVAVTAVLI